MDENDNLKRKTIGGFIWLLAERSGAQIVSFVVSIILARLLSPDAYGTVSLVTVFTTIVQVFVDSGMGSALVQKKNPDDLDYSSVFFFNMFMCTILYICMFFAAPYIAGFYDKPELTPLVRVISITLIISGLRSVQQSYISKHMLFKKFFFSTLGGTVISALLGIFMAYKGYGAWALVVQQLSNTAIDTFILWLTVKWRPKFMFSFTRLKGLFSFGWKMLISSLIDTGYNQLRQLIIGKKYSSTDLAYYNKGSFPSIIIGLVNSSINSVLMPTMASVQDSSEAVKNITRRSIKTSTYIMAPLFMGLAFCGKPLISLLYTDKWLPVYPFLVIFCITYMFYPVHTANLNAIKAMGRSDLFLKLEIMKKLVGLSAILITMNIGVMAMAYSLLVTSIMSQIINSWPNKRLLKYSYLEQLKDILPGILLAAFMGGCVWTVTLLKLSPILTLIIQVPLGAAIYIGLSALFKLDSFKYVLDILKPALCKFMKRKNS